MILVCDLNKDEGVGLSTCFFEGLFEVFALGDPDESFHDAVVVFDDDGWD